MSGTSKLAADKNQRILLELVNQPGNDICADCKTRTPRWASHNLGIFICMNCASIHRKIGTHITKVKSLTIDTWTKEQVEHMKQAGNLKSNTTYNPDEKRHPPPTNMIDSERDSELEKYIRAKYEFRSFMRHTPEGKPKLSPLVPSSSVDRSAAVTALLGPSRSAASRAASMSTFRPRDTAPLVDMSLSSQDKPTPPASAPALPTRPQNRSVSQPLLSSIPAGAQGQSAFGSSLTSSRPQTIDATLPLQVLPPASAPPPPSYLSAANPFHNLQTGSAPLPQSSFGQTTGVSPGLGVSSTGMSSSFSGTNLSPFQASPFGAAPLSSTPSPHPFSPQGLSIGPNGINTQSTTTNQSQIAFSQPFGQSQTPFGQPNQASFGQPSQFLFTQTIQTPFNQPVSIGQQFGQQHAQAQSYTQQQQMQMQFAQPQPQLHTSAPGNPYLQTPSPFMGAQSVGGSPSPLAQTQALPQTNTTQTGFGGANPFTSWIQQPPAQQQGGYSRQWGM